LSALVLTVDPRSVRVLVVGEGAAAAREAERVIAAGGPVRVVSPEPGAELRALAARAPGLVLTERPYAPEDVAWATIVFAASDDPLLNGRVVDHAHAAGRLVNVSSPGTGTFQTPHAVRAGHLVIAVDAGDVEPLARRIRDHVGERIGPAYAQALDGLLALRAELLAAGQDQRWQDALEALVDEDTCASIERGAFVRRLAAWR
jgi:siroheme synthase-like protein